MNLEEAEKLGIEDQPVLDAIIKDHEKLEAEKLALIATNKKIKDEKVEVLTKYRTLKEQFKDVDVDEYNKLKDTLSKIETSKLIDNDKAEEAIKKAGERAEEKYASELEARDMQLKSLAEELDKTKQLSSTLQESLVTTVRNKGLASAFLAKKADGRILQAAQIQASGTVRVETDEGFKYKPIIEVDNSGNSIFRDPNSGEMLRDKYGKFSYEQYVDYLAEKDYLPVYSEPKGGNFTGGGAIPKNLKRSEMSIDDKLAFEENHGKEALLSLPE